MFSCAYWQTYEIWGYACDEYGEPHRLNDDAWRAAWLFYYSVDLSGSANNSYPISKDFV